ncbi:centromere protein M-like isoform X1 [Cyclopterus lumpus]|uniref:centromere protein M isoform X1 n=1 Tax=Cyclopterus lumpus TaxID=8103 RepID=UPI0014868F3C|nr:centromere protein M isoform X1 [Cyclopterus lumpus]XP_034401404.1 centromere protein M-like isoform X1 [Cyclopterus lumpus]
MSLLKPFSKLPGLNSANILLVESKEEFQQSLADALVQETAFTVNVRLAKSLPLPMENEESRPRIDLVAFIIDLTSELSFQSTEASLKCLDPGYFLGKVCFMVTNARNAAAPIERLDAVRKLAASLHCPLLFTEDQRCVMFSPLQTPDGVTNATERLLTILKVAAGLVPMATALYLSNLTRSTVSPDIDQPSFD